MSDNGISIKQADKNIYQYAFADGLVDIFITSVILMFVVAPVLSVHIGDYWSAFIFLPFWGVVSLVLSWIRKKVIKPRSGTVTYGKYRKKKITLFTGIMLGLNVAFIIIGFVLFAAPTATGWKITLLFSGILLISFSLAGYFLDITRFYFYGFMLSAGFVVGEWLYQTFGIPHHGIPIVFGFAAGLIFFTGLYRFLSFLRQNPLPAIDEMHWQGNNG